MTQPGALSPASAARISHTDSSSDLSDCPSEALSDEQRFAQAANSDAESGTGSSDREREPPPSPPPLPSGPGGGPQHSLPSPEPPSKGPAKAPAPSGVQGEEVIWGRGPEKASAKSAQPAGTQRLGGKIPMVAPSYERQLVADQEELLREIEELHSENDYLKVNGGRLEGAGRLGLNGRTEGLGMLNEGRSFAETRPLFLKKINEGTS